MIARLSASLGTALALALAAPATAQDPAASAGSDAAALRNQITALQAQVDALKARLDAQDTRIASASTAALEATKKSDEAVTAATATKVAWKGAPELSSSKGWSFKPRGRLQIDAGYLGAPDSITDDGKGFSNELRRLRLGAEGTIPGGFGYRFEVEFAGGDAQLWDGYINYKTGGLTITAGQHNPFQSLDELTSSNDTVFIERAAFTDAFNFERRIGLSAQYSTGPVLLQGGVFTDNATDLSDDGNSSWSVDGRAVVAPKMGSTQLHIAASAHRREFGDVITSARYRQRPLIHSTDIRFIDTGNLGSATTETDYGLEALAIAGRFHAAGEAHWLELARTGAPNPGFFGGYAEAGYFLTDSAYGYRDGVLRAPKIAKPVGSGGIGAVSIDLRYDYLDLTDASASVFGGKQNGILAGISWWPVENLRFLLNYGHLNYSGAKVPAGTDRDYSADVVGGRAQVSF
jgi:phosphate-selective porin OprO/OprP